ncbi:hypothetical protein Ddc_12927 [Ditylenchus destructor]|nr:hypothetical protein Ddc_12927 [Ditylenchus destructor]
MYYDVLRAALIFLGDDTPVQHVPERSADGKFHVVMDFVLDFPEGTKPVIHLDNLANRKKDIHAAIVKKKTKKT